MRIYDCFMFYNEFDLLEIRLKELYDHVDLFVIVESNLSHTNNSKSFRFEQHKERYLPWIDKIQYIKHISNASSNPWTNETAQRLAISQGIQDAHENDIVIISDLDEIVRHNVVQELRQDFTNTIYGFNMPLFNFKFNFMRVDPGPHDVWAMAARAGWIKRFSPQELRNLKHNLFNTVPDCYLLNHKEIRVFAHGGWHFGYLGDNKWLLEKANNNCHQEDINEEFLQQLDVEKSIQEKKCWNRAWPYRYEIVDLDSYFPTSCRDYPQHCLPNSGISAQDILKQHDAR